VRGINHRSRDSLVPHLALLPIPISPLHFPTSPHPCHNRLMPDARFAAAQSIRSDADLRDGRPLAIPCESRESRDAAKRGALRAREAGFSSLWKLNLPKLPFMFAAPPPAWRRHQAKLEASHVHP